ncbi:MAG TPA: energy-coupling factor ABC transporter permease, partial [Victivallales bacterium]|nr:energy-coupling factor ABC transporter permease [Victivallales bacterium]
SIPGTGSSGHLGGGLILTVLLGPYRAFITLASVLVIQCLFFLDGGLLALGCNIFNLAFFPAFIAFPYIYRLIIGDKNNKARLAAACIAGSVAGLLMGAFTVVIQTVLSGISDLPFTKFTMFMLPIHIAIGIVEGIVTFSVISFVNQTQPGIIEESQKNLRPAQHLIAIFAIVTLLVGGVLSWFASSSPDGLEWSISKVTGQEELKETESRLGTFLSSLQEKIAFLPDYTFKNPVEADDSEKSFVASNMGTTVSGILGGFLVFALAGVAGLALRNRLRTVEDV